MKASHYVNFEQQITISQLKPVDGILLQEMIENVIFVPLEISATNFIVY